MPFTGFQAVGYFSASGQARAKRSGWPERFLEYSGDDQRDEDE